MPDRVLLLASQNAGKLAEMRQLVAGLPFVMLGPSDVGIADAPDETGTSFLENAVLKAQYYSERAGLLTVADDSGIIVDALGGEPGLHSSRFGGPDATDADRNRLLLHKLEGVPADRRGARFVSAVAVARAGRLLFQVERSVEGTIAAEPRGSHGFGYDPIFYFPPARMTFGEMARAEKDRVSHRGRSFAAVRGFLEALGG